MKDAFTASMANTPDRLTQYLADFREAMAEYLDSRNQESTMWEKLWDW